LPKKGIIHGLWYDAVHVFSRAVKSHRHLYWLHCLIWDDRREASRWLERDLFANDHVHKHHGLFLSFPWTDARVHCGRLSLVVLAIAVPARYLKDLAGAWRKSYAVTASIALYLSVFVLVAQLFMKVPSLHVLAPTGSQPPFLISQAVLMAIFIVLTIAATMKFHPEAVHAS